MHIEGSRFQYMARVKSRLGDSYTSRKKREYLPSPLKSALDRCLPLANAPLRAFVPSWMVDIVIKIQVTGHEDLLGRIG